MLNRRIYVGYRYKNFLEGCSICVIRYSVLFIIMLASCFYI